ncbi:hypothetical protein [Luteimonas sp. TWI875]|uniref:hypothetical protein n=1 Tax=unclassified Luteimonas TaxID=2629088 RepID=UPI00320995B8
MAASHILLLTLLAAPTVAGCASKPPLPRSVTEADVTTPQGHRLTRDHGANARLSLQF